MRIISVDEFEDLPDFEDLAVANPEKVVVGQGGYVILILHRRCGEVICVEMQMTMVELSLKPHELAADGIDLEVRNN